MCRRASLTTGLGTGATTWQNTRCTQFPRNHLVTATSGRSESRQDVVAIREIGAPGEIRTPDHLVRSQVLYPAELRARGSIRRAAILSQWVSRPRTKITPSRTITWAPPRGAHFPPLGSRRRPSASPDAIPDRLGRSHDNSRKDIPFVGVVLLRSQSWPT